MEALLSFVVSLLVGGALVGAARGRVSPDDSAAPAATGGAPPPPQQFAFNGVPYTPPPSQVDVPFTRPGDKLNANTKPTQSFVYQDDDAVLRIHVPQLTAAQAAAKAARQASDDARDDAAAKSAIANTLGRVPGVGTIVTSFTNAVIGSDPITAEEILRNQAILTQQAQTVVYNPDSGQTIFQQLDPSLQQMADEGAGRKKGAVL